MELSVYDIAGRKVATLIDGERPSGEQSIDWRGLNERGRPVSSGVYLIRLRSAMEARVERLVLLR